MSAEKKAIDLTDYKYVDVWYSDAEGKNSPWKRIEIDQVSKFQQEEAYNFNCFATVQQFANKTKTKGEAFIAPLYFDLDNADPSRAQADAIKIIDFFMNELDIQPSDCWVFFSGSKGFHVLISSRALGVEPRDDLHKVYKQIAGYIRYRLGAVIAEPSGDRVKPLESLDLVVYTDKRMLRLNNSIHHKTKLFKIELTLNELRNLTLDEIKTKAQKPRRADEGLLQRTYDSLALRPKAADFYKDKLAEYIQASATATQRFDKEEYSFNKDQPPVCVQDIYNGGWKKDGDRNQATIQLACYFKAAGYSQEEALEQLEGWVTKHTTAKGDYNIRQRIANTKSVTESVYAEENNYRFGCAFIRSLHGDKEPGATDYERVPCAGDFCHCLKRNVDAEADAQELHLAATGAADYTGKLIKTRVMVAGKKHTPYIVPKKIEYSCWGRATCKKVGCPLLNMPVGTAYKDLGVTNRELIQMTATGDDNIKGILRELSNIPSCQRFDMTVVETTNIDELLVIPMAETGAEVDDDKAGSGKYVLRRVYSVGGLPISENKYYEISGYVFPHPKNQESTILIRDAKPLQDVVERFELTAEVKESLKILQPQDYTMQGIVEKLGAILADITYNVTHIVERDETLLGLLLTYHSVLRFNVPWDTQPIRGWLEMKIVGDTGTGKSALVEKTMKYAGLGTRVNAESTSRTGLTYKMEQSGTGGAWYIVWGAWPLADKELIWIDEDTGIEKNEYGEMTMARSDGKLEVKRAVTAETPCRVRAVLSGNVPKGKRLAEYAQGVEAMKDIFNNEDIRRFDFAVFMKATDVDPELYNRQLPTYPKTLTEDIFKDNILFAWSRQPENVKITDEAIEKLLEVSTDLSKIYGNATDVPLVSPSDQRNKIARLSVALAALTHSVDDTGDNIIVHPGHVEFIQTYLKGIYNAPGCGLNYYAKLAVKEEELTLIQFNKLVSELRTVDTLKGDNKYMEFVTLFAQQKYLRLGDVETMLCIEKDEAKAILNQCVRLRMLQMTSGGYRKTPRFNAFIAKNFELGKFDGMENDL